MYTMPSFFFVIPIEAARGLAQSSVGETKRRKKYNAH